MINRSTFLILFLSICAFTAVYLYYVKKERQNSIANYFPDPKIGDVYKMQRETYEDGLTVFYLKIKDIGEESIYFYPGRFYSGAMENDLLNDYDASQTKVYTKKELSDIIAGKWIVSSKDKTQLLEIERK
jgi:hypothetical protein